MTIFAPTLGAIWKQLEGYGINPEPLFREHGIDPEVMFDSGARISTRLYQKLDVQAAKLSGDDCYGLKGAEYFRPAHLGALGFAWLASSSLRTAFERLSRYARIINEKMVVTLEEDDRFFSVTVDASLPLLQQRIREDGQLAALVKFCRIIAGKNFVPENVWFRHAQPRNTAPYYTLFRCPVEFNRKTTTLFIPVDVIDKRLTGSNDQLAKLNEHIVVKYLAHCEKKDIINRVKAAIIDGLGSGGVGEASVADQLHMTPRTMHRKLQKEGASFKTLLTETRRDLAQQYIHDRTKTLTEISFLLGFSEVSSFSRAYKGWTGQPPSEARQALA
jgi:AraC-like DNA-binding protein